MTGKKNIDALYNDIIDDDYLVRYHACRKILASAGINREVCDIRKVFRCITTCCDGTPGEYERALYRQGAENLRNFIAAFGSVPDFALMTMEALNDELLDECYGVSRKPDLEIIRELVRYGADIHTVDEDGFSAFMRGVHIPDYEIMEFFLTQGADINAQYPYRNRKSETVWLGKVGFADVPLLKLMLGYGADTGAVNAEGNSALHLYAAGKGEYDGLLALIEAGADVALQNQRGEIALHLLCGRNVAENAVRLMVQKGAAVDVRDNSGETPLHRAAHVQGGDGTVIDYLCREGAGPDIKNNDGLTPLLIAVQTGNAAAVRVLVSHGADVTFYDVWGQEPCDIALDMGYVAIAGILRGEDAGAEYRSRPAYQELMEIQKEIITLLKGGKQVYRSDKEGYARFLYRGGCFYNERYDEGKGPPVVTVFQSEDAALEYLYGIFHYTVRNKTEVEIFRKVRDALH